MKVWLSPGKILLGFLVLRGATKPSVSPELTGSGLTSKILFFWLAIAGKGVETGAECMGEVGMGEGTESAEPPS
jgi:hypothetical protein